MTRSSRTPPTLLTLARRSMKGDTRLPAASCLVVGVSGGPDSMALLHVLGALRSELALEVHAHGVDHGLRATASDELDLAQAFAARLDIPFARSRVAVASGGNLHARAREARLDALARAADRVRACAIATAHHADDRAETLLLRLLRGAGSRGLAVLPPRARFPRRVVASEASATSLELIRPLLRARRSDVLAHLARHDIPFALDPSNRDPRFARSRVRAELLPLLESMSPAIVNHLEALADELCARRDGPESVLALPRATQLALGALLRDAAASPEEASDRREVWLPGGLVVTRGSGRRRSSASATPKSSPHRAHEASPEPPRSPMLDHVRAASPVGGTTSPAAPMRHNSSSLSRTGPR